MTILIADDDRKIRFYLKSMLADIPSLDCRILEAKNGLEMVEKCEMYRPEIVFVDIDMPCMDGLSAIDRCRNISPVTQYVVLTGYPSFLYAQKCVSLPVCDYILKPIESQKLKDILRKLQENLSTVLNHDNNGFQLALYNRFSLWDEIGTGCGADLEGGYWAFLFFIDCPSRTDRYPGIYRDLFLRIKSIGEQYVEKHILYGLVNSREGILRAVFQCDSRSENDIFRQIELACHSLTNENGIVSCLYAQADSLADLYNKCQKIESAQYLRFSYSPAGVNLLPEQVEPAYEKFLKALSELLTAYMEADALRYKSILNDLPRNFSSVNALISFQNLSKFLSGITGSRIEASDFHGFYQTLALMPENMYGQAAPQCELIEKIKDYIRQNYMNDIGINELSDCFHLTPNYLSTIFHEKAGVRFIDYLTEVRIENAKRILIRNIRTNIKDVSIMVGYYSTRHFSDVFQKYTGKSPSDFRRSYFQA